MCNQNQNIKDIKVEGTMITTDPKKTLGYPEDWVNTQGE